MTRSILFTLLSLSLLSCMDQNWNDPEDLDLNYSGVYIVNSGNFQSSTASLDYYDKEKKVVYNNVISRANGIQNWGDVAQSMVIKDGIGYVVINNSGKIMMIDTNNAKYAGKIGGLQSPRYMHFINDSTAYVSDLYGRNINIVNPPEPLYVDHADSAFSDSTLNTSDVNTGLISVNNQGPFFQHSTEKMVQWGHLVFVACWMRDNQILVIDSNTDQVLDSITVAAQPNSLQIDKYNKLWVLCDGGYEGNPFAYENPKLISINLHDYTTAGTYEFGLEENPQELCINNTRDMLYYLNSDLYKMSVNSLTPSKFITSGSKYSGYGRGFYGLAIDPSNNDIYISDALDNAQPGYVYRFTSNAIPVDTFKVGVNPVGFCFK